MFGFQKPRQDARSSQQFENSSVLSAANSSRAAVDVQRELVRVAFRDTLRATGVPPQWLDCEIRSVPTPQGGEQLYISLVMHKWSGHLLRYAMAFQKQVLLCLDRYDPNVNHAAYEWSWKFAADCDCPFPAMPAYEEWAAKLEASTPKTAGSSRKVPAVRSNPIKTTQAPAPIPPSVPSTGFRDIFADI